MSQFALRVFCPTLTLFKTTGTGMILRSPHEIIHYLGQIVKQSFVGADNGLLTITSPSGREVPIFTVKEGKNAGKTAAVAARVDDENYWIPPAKPARGGNTFQLRRAQHRKGYNLA